MCFMNLCSFMYVLMWLAKNDSRLQWPSLIGSLNLVIQGQVVTTIGFLKDAPQVYVHGFNVYHKNRLILVTFFQLQNMQFKLANGCYFSFHILPLAKYLQCFLCILWPGILGGSLHNMDKKNFDCYRNWILLESESTLFSSIVVPTFLHCSTLHK